MKNYYSSLNKLIISSFEAQITEPNVRKIIVSALAVVNS